MSWLWTFIKMWWGLTGEWDPDLPLLITGSPMATHIQKMYK